jgi:hypothetical protein
MNRTTTGPGDLADVLRVLLLLQAALFLVLAIEALVFGGLFGPTALGGAALSLAVALGLLAARARLERLGRRGRRLLLGLQGVLLAGAVLDTLLAYLMADQLLGLVPALTRGVLPVAIVVLVRQVGRTPAGAALPGLSPAPDMTPPPDAVPAETAVPSPALPAGGAA